MQTLHKNVQLFLVVWIRFIEVPEQIVYQLRVSVKKNGHRTPAPIFRVKLYLVTSVMNIIRGQEAKKDPGLV